MGSLSKIRNSFKNLPFYSEEIKSVKKKNENFTNINLLSELPFFYKKPKALSNKELSEALPFLPKRPKRSKRPKRLTKHKYYKIYYLFMIV